MKIELYGEALRDEVLGAIYWVGRTDYEFAIAQLYPLIQRLEIQRGLQNPLFYSRLRSDLKVGCVVPPITLAFIMEGPLLEIDRKFIESNIQSGFVLDGIQRLNAIRSASEEIEDDEAKKVFLDRTLHLNVIVSPSMDRLLYRMITLNNGQKPMSPRHQIDILSETIFDFDNLSLRNQPHKERQQFTNRLAIHRSDIVKGYIAYLSNTTAIDNKLIIEEKMDSLIAERIIDSDIGNEKFEFIDVLRWISGVCRIKEVNIWFVSSNNFIGFCVAARSKFDFIRAISAEDLMRQIDRFEEIFSTFDKRKIKVGDYRRKKVSEYFGELQKFSSQSVSDVVLDLSQR
jgi:hypothetical protein